MTSACLRPCVSVFSLISSVRLSVRLAAAGFGLVGLGPEWVTCTGWGPFLSRSCCFALKRLYKAAGKSPNAQPRCAMHHRPPRRPVSHAAGKGGVALELKQPQRRRLLSPLPVPARLTVHQSQDSSACSLLALWVQRVERCFHATVAIASLTAT